MYLLQLLVKLIVFIGLLVWIWYIVSYVVKAIKVIFKPKLAKDVTKDLDFVRLVTINNIADSLIDESKIHGFGLFAKKDFKAGEVLCILDGQMMDWDFYDELARRIDLKEYQNYIFMEWNALSEKTLLVRPFRTKYSYINHSDAPNVEVKYDPMRIEAVRNIHSGDEILLDYSKEPLKRDYLEDKEKSFIEK